jgi:hypothetical protein
VTRYCWQEKPHNFNSSSETSISLVENKKNPKNKERDPDNPEPTDEGDIQMKYFSD